MASAATVNTWTEDLVKSLLLNRIVPGKSRRLHETFSRSIKHHNYGRTNQFDVQERLAGLEEKLQILNRDDLSDALHSRRQELNSRSERWLPDVLDFLLRMSDDPVNKSQTQDLSTLATDGPTQQLLTWAEVEARDPIDRRDRIWRQPDYSDFSSDEDEVVPSSDATSPASVKFHEPAMTHRQTADKSNPIDTVPHSRLAEQFHKNIFWAQESGRVRMTEVQAVREILFLCQGLPTALFSQAGGKITPNPKYCLDSADESVVTSTLHDVVGVASSAIYIKSWLLQSQPTRHLQVLQDEIRQISLTFDTWISSSHKETLSATMAGGVVSLLGTVKAIEREAGLTSAVERFLRDVHDADPIKYLEVLFQHICRAEMCTSDYVEALVAIFLATLNAYLIPVDKWILEGEIDMNKSSFFVERVENENQKSSLWRTWYTCIDSGPSRCPQFLTDHQKDIFATGKTVAFLREFSTPNNVPCDTTLAGSLGLAMESACRASESSLIPLAASIDSHVREHLNHQLNAVTSQLQTILQQNCGLSKTMDAVEFLFLARNGVLLDSYETKMFEQIDKSITSWNDSYILSDQIEEVYNGIESVEPEQIVVHGDVSSKKSLSLRRLSVEILGDLAIEYVVPWPIANIIPSEALAFYRRIALLLCQIRRAKYELDRVAYGRVQHLPESAFSKITQATHFALLFFVNTLYDHLVCCVIRPLTHRMREELTGTLDQMIEVHAAYVVALEYSCLISKNLKVLKDTVLTLLDICVQFGLQPPTSREGIDDIGGKTRKHVVFLVAGLRGVAASGGATAESLELLADRLDGMKVEKLPG